MVRGYETYDPEYRVGEPKTVIFFMICRLCRRMLGIYPTSEGVITLDMYSWTEHFKRHNIPRDKLSYRTHVVKIKLKRCESLCRIIDLKQEEKHMSKNARL